MKILYRSAFLYALIGLVLGVFYREFTKMYEFTAKTQLSYLHVHALILGTLFFLILLLYDNSFGLSAQKGFNVWFGIYNVGLIGTLSAMIARGTIQVLGREMSGLNHIAGLFHALLGTALIWIIMLLGKSLKSKHEQIV